MAVIMWPPEMWWSPPMGVQAPVREDEEPEDEEPEEEEEDPVAARRLRRAVK